MSSSAQCLSVSPATTPEVLQVRSGRVAYGTTSALIGRTVTTSDTVIAAYSPPAVRAFHASHVAATLCCFVVLLAPALWNRYPLLQYDTGGYLARWYEGYLVPSRSTVCGLFLHAGEGFHFWPELILQGAYVIWIISLVLRVTGLASDHWHQALIVAGLSLATALPILTST